MSSIANALALGVAGFSAEAVACFGVYALFVPLFLHSRMTGLA